MRSLRTPGVYTEEVSTLPPSVVAVETAIPAFIGYTEKRPSDTIEAYRVASMNDYHNLFGGPYLERIEAPEIQISGDTNNSLTITQLPSSPRRPSFWLYYQLQMFYANGGGSCFIISVGTYEDDPGPNAQADRRNNLLDGLSALRKEDVPTLILLPDIIHLMPPSNPVLASYTNYYSIYQEALQQCFDLKDRFTIIDIHPENENRNPIDIFRDNLSTNYPNYGATYYPWLVSNLVYAFDESRIEIRGADLPEADEMVLKYDTTDLTSLADVDDGQGNPLEDEAKQAYYESRSLFHRNNGAYAIIKGKLNSFTILIPPSGAIAGIYATVDNSRGVFKAPANASLSNVIKPAVKINNELQEELNVHPTGKSVNAIRSFSGKGVLVWGARTLDGNSNEFRYVSVRRFFIFAEESISKAMEGFVFEPNNQSTWVKVKGTIENFLTDQWRAGALAGSTPNQAFFVKIGLGETMTPQDILEGKLIVLVGMATVRPAEFIVLRFTHKLQES